MADLPDRFSLDASVPVSKPPYIDQADDSSDTVTKVDEGAAGDYKARHLIRWFNEGADGKIPWGSPGDFDACVRVASEHMPIGKAKGFCANRHHDALGIWPATHAAAERHHARKEAAGWGDLSEAAEDVIVELVKAGPKGYIHGWVYVGPQGVGEHVEHHEHGHGQIVRAGKATVGVQFDNGHYAAFEHAKSGNGDERFIARSEHRARSRPAKPPKRVRPAESATVSPVSARDAAPVVNADAPGIRDWQEYGKFVNDYLRGTLKGQRISKEHADQITADLDRTFRDVPTLEEPLTVYRGLSEDWDLKSGQERALFGDDDPTGKVFHDPGFESATPSRNVAEIFTGGAGKPTLLEMAIPAGQKAIKLKGNLEREDEVLLPRSLSFEVTGERYDGKLRVLTVRVLPSAESPESSPEVPRTSHPGVPDA